MFLSNFANAAEREARARQRKQENDGKNAEIVQPRELVSSGTIPLPDMINYLDSCTRKMILEETRNAILQQYDSIPDAPIFGLIVQLQRQEFISRGYDADFGSRQLGQLLSAIGDGEVSRRIKAMKLMSECMDIIGRDDIPVLHKNKGKDRHRQLSREEIMEFFEGCMARFQMPGLLLLLMMMMLDIKKRLREKAIDHATAVQQEMLAIQASILDKINIDRTTGVSQLNAVSTAYGQDQQILGKMRQFTRCAEFAYQEAIMDQASVDAFYQSMPKAVHHMPHLFQQFMSMQQDGGCQDHSHSHDHGHSHGHSHDHGHAHQHNEHCSHGHGQHQEGVGEEVPFTTDDISQALADPELKASLSNFSMSLPNRQSRAAEDISSMSANEKEDYVRRMMMNEFLKLGQHQPQTQPGANDDDDHASGNRSQPRATTTPMDLLQKLSSPNIPLAERLRYATQVTESDHIEVLKLQMLLQAGYGQQALREMKAKETENHSHDKEFA